MKINKFKKLLSYYKPHRKTLFFDLLFTVISSAIALIIPLIVKYVTENVLTLNTQQATKTVIEFVGIVALLLLVSFGCERYILFYGHLMGACIEADMRKEMFKHYQSLSLEFYDNQKVGNLMSRMTNDLYNIGEFLHHAPETGLEISLRVIGTLTIIFLTNKILAFTTLFILIILLIYIFKCTPKLNSLNRECNMKMNEINAGIEENLSNIRVVKAFAQAPLEIKKFDQCNKKFLSTKRNSFKMFSIFHAVNSTCIISLIPIVTTISMFLIARGIMTISELLMYILYADLLIGPLCSFVEMLDDFYQYYIGYARFIEILEIEPKIKNLPEAISLEKTHGLIEFKNITFSYYVKNQNTNKSSLKTVFKNFNLKINPGEYVALVGASGVGKSTLCSLLLRFYEIDKGEILIDGRNIRNFTIESLRKNISFVQQETFLFAGSVMENIRYGRLDATDEEIIEAAKKAYAHDFIMELPDGYKTSIGQRGFKLSGGQKQRISIARFFLKDSPILILDEATSSLDNESEKAVHKSFEKLAKNCTTIVIAHRLSTVKNAQRIIVLNNNGIAEEGTHEELLAKKGVYYSWYKLI